MFPIFLLFWHFLYPTECIFCKVFFFTILKIFWWFFLIKFFLLLVQDYLDSENNEKIKNRLLGDKLLDMDLELKKILKILVKLKIKNIFQDERVVLKSIYLPRNFPKRNICDTRILQINESVSIEFPKRDYILAWLILWTEYANNEETIKKIELNGVLIENQTFIFYINNLKKSNNIVIHYACKEHAKDSTCSIYYLITPNHSDNYYLHKILKKS